MWLYWLWWGQTPLVLGGKRGKGRDGWDGLGAQEGWGVWLGQGNTAGPSFSTGAGEESRLCEAAWMASRSSTNTSLWLWQGLLCRAADLLDTRNTDPEPTFKVHTPVLHWIWKVFVRMRERLLLPSALLILQHIIWHQWQHSFSTFHNQQPVISSFHHNLE